MLPLLACDPSTVSLGKARHLEVFAMAQGADVSAVELLIHDRKDCLELSDSARAAFDDLPLQLRSPGGVIETRGYDHVCVNAEFSMTLPEASDSGVAHVFTIDDDGHKIVIELPHYLLRPTLSISSTTFHVGDAVTETWSPSDLDLCGLKGLHCRLDLYQSTGSWLTYYTSFDSVIDGNTIAFTVPESAAGADGGQLMLQELLELTPEPVGSDSFPAGLPATPISRCEGAETCIATPPYFPVAIDVVVEPSAPDGGA
jgi:hypothetical protein